MLNLSTDDLRFLATKLLNKVDFKPKEFGLDDAYLNDLRDALITMADTLDSNGEFDININNKKEKDDAESKTEKTKAPSN